VSGTRTGTSASQGCSA